jgi:hypothetical protein
MTRTLPANVATAAQAPGYRACYAVEILTGTPIRVTDCPGGVTIGGHVFAYGFLQLGDTTYDNHPALSILMGNTDNALSSVDLADLGRGVLENIAVNVWEVMWNPAGGAQLTEVPLLGSAAVVGYTCDEGSMQLTAQGTVESAAGMAGRVCSRSCMHVFKGARCGYGGGATYCGHTFASCTTLGNTARFGGFQTMPTLNTRLSYWVVSYVPASYRYGSTVPQSSSNPSTTLTGSVVRPHLHAVTPKPATTQPITTVVTPTGGGFIGSGGDPGGHAT